MALYKYVLADRIDVLQNRLIRFSQPSALNDPWEMKPHIKTLLGDELIERNLAKPMRERTDDVLVEEMAKILGEVLRQNNFGNFSHDQLKTLLVEANTQFPGEIRTLFAESTGEALEQFKSLMPEITSTIPAAIDTAIGILSLTEKPDHPLMWSHYANNHAGLVIEFDEGHEFFAEQKEISPKVSGLHKVIYSRERPTFETLLDTDLMEGGEEKQAEWLEKMFFTKSKEWEYEQEWRMIKPLKKADRIIELAEGNVHLFALPPVSITGLILGEKMRSETRASIINTVAKDDGYSHLTISEAVSDNTAYAMKIRKIR